MKFALHFANSNFPDAAGAKRLALAAEAAGFESLLVVEHVVWPTQYDSIYPYAPAGRLPGGPETKLPDPLIWMAFAAAVTTRLSKGGKYIAVTATFQAQSRVQLDALYQELSTHEFVVMVL